jgi:GNAT superfamily N-acetyltransferase
VSSQVKKHWRASGRVRLAWTMRIEQWDPADEKTLLACHAVYCAAAEADEPVEPLTSAITLRELLTSGWEGDPGENWVGYDDSGAVVGWYRLELPDLENKERGFLLPTVHPAARRRGTGRELLRHAAQRATANGRTLLDGVVAEDGAGEEFARALGAKFTIAEVRRVQSLRKIAPGTITELRADAARASNGYSLVSWTGPIPERYLAGAAGVFNAFNDAPHPEGIEDATWDADRVRERTGRLVRAGAVRAYGLAALHDATGEMAGFTIVDIDQETPHWGRQQLTAVTRAHRGHQLGLLLKVGMLDLLAAAEPQVESISTGNAAQNAHMIAVNERLGYEVVKPGWHFYELPVDAVQS